MPSTFITTELTVTRVMLKVLLALVPALVAYVHYFGPIILVDIALATITALVCEAIMLKIRGAPLKPFLIDLSAVVTAWLLAMSMPPILPWWLTVGANAFAIVVVKHLYGGLGSNPFNPAMAGYAAALVSFPLQMSHWSPPYMLSATITDFNTQLEYIFREFVGRRFLIDAETMATPLDVVKTATGAKQTIADISYMPVFGDFGGAGSEIVTLGFLIGGLYMLHQRIITWHMPAAFIGAIGVLALGSQLILPAKFAGPMFHWFAGATMLGAFFIITDPVSAATTPKGKLIFAAGAGILTFFIRVFGGYPDGVAFAVLVMNACVPLIDTYTQPSVFGRRHKTRDHATP
jgi:Na+-translocating ferredoxin:NAD+ oxidoreductase subunit D